MSLPPDAARLDALEEELYHALEANASPLARTIYEKRMMGAAWMVDCGEVARAERVLRRLLEQVNDGPDLHEDLGCVLERQGRLVEAARHYWRALRGSSHSADKPRLLLRLARNAALRGRLPMAARFARRALPGPTPLGTADLALEGCFIVAWIAHLLQGEGRFPSGLELDTALSLLHASMLVQRGEIGPARLLTEALSPAWGENTTLAHEIRLARIRARFEMQVRASTRPPSDIAAATLGDAHLHRALDFFRHSGQCAILSQGLLFTARLRRLAGDGSGAINDLEESQDQARRCGLGLQYIDGLLESRHVHGEAPVRDALDRSLRRNVRYAWGAVEATLWLGLRERGVDDVTLEARLADSMRRIESRLQRCGLPSTPLSPDDVSALLRIEEETPFLVGVGGLSHEVTAVGTAGLALRLPVEAHFADRVRTLTDSWDAEEAEHVWDVYYESQLRDRDQPGPTYHLGVLCLMLGLERLAIAIADDLARCRPPVPGAACLLAACAETPAMSISILRSSSDASKTAAYNLGVLCEHAGHMEEGRRAYERALRTDWAYAPARTRLRALDLCEGRERCRRILKQALHAATIFQAQALRMPTDLPELVPALLATVPSCPDRGSTYLVRASASGDRLLLACRDHALRLDSRRGDLAPPPPLTPLDPTTAAFLHHMRDLRPHIMEGARLFVTTSRPARIVEQGVHDATRP